MPNGLVYILTNPCLDGWVKIGMTECDDITERLRSLNAPSNIPLLYRCYAVYEVDKPAEVEKHIHQLIDIINPQLHARETLPSGRIREREFFRLSPETAYSILRHIAELRGDVLHLELRTPTIEETQELEIADTRSKRSNNRFDKLGIAVGEKISFLYDPNIVVEVFNHVNKVTYQGEVYSLSALAHKLLVECFRWSESAQVNGWRYFTKDNIPLSDLRDRLEADEDEE